MKEATNQIGTRITKLFIILLFSISVFFLLTTFPSCQSNSSEGKTSPSIIAANNSSNNTDPYDMMHEVFIGNPETEELKPLLEEVLRKYDLAQTDEQRLKVGSMLVSLRKHNEGKVTEMEILNHIFINGSDQISLPDQAALSTTILLVSE